MPTFIFNIIFDTCNGIFIYLLSHLFFILAASVLHNNDNPLEKSSTDFHVSEFLNVQNVT